MVHAHRKFRRFRFYIGITVSITADPGAEADQAGDRKSSVNTVDPVDCVFQFTVDPGHRFEQRLLKKEQSLSNFIQDLGFLGPHLVGFPQDLDLSFQLAVYGLLVLKVELTLVQLLRQQEDATLDLHDGASFGLSGMGREHRRVDDVLEQAAEMFHTDTAVVEVADGVIE